MLLEELLIRPTEVGHAPVMDALSEADALQEAQLLDVRVCALTSTVGLLFDLRMALQLRTANTAVVVGRGVQDFSWSAEHRETARTAWNVAGSEPAGGDLFSLSLAFFPRARLRLVSERAEFYVGEVAGLDPTPPDYGVDDEARIKAGLAGWASTFEPVQATFLDLSTRA
jgi:hypothetical protein